MKQQSQQAVVENENNNKELDRQNRIDIAMIQSEGAQVAQDFNLQKSMKDFEIKDTQVGLKAGDLSEKIRSNKADEQLKRESQSQDVKDNNADRALKTKQMQQQKNKPKQ